jgi:hypothetical protein
MPIDLREQLLLALLAEHSNEMRSQAQTEHIHTAAAVGAFGAVTWGVATVPEPIPAAAAVLGVVLVSWAVITKIRLSHETYRGLKAARAKVCAEIASRSECGAVISKGLLSAEAGRGYLSSIAVVVSAAIGAVGFCAAIAIWH